MISFGKIINLALPISIESKSKNPTSVIQILTKAEPSNARLN